MMRLVIISDLNPNLYVTSCGFFAFSLIIYTIVNKKKASVMFLFMFSLFSIVIKTKSKFMETIFILLCLIHVGKQIQIMVKGKKVFKVVWIIFLFLCILWTIIDDIMLVFFFKVNEYLNLLIGFDLTSFSSIFLIENNNVSEFNLVKSLFLVILKVLHFTQ